MQTWQVFKQKPQIILLVLHWLLIKGHNPGIAEKSLQFGTKIKQNYINKIAFNIEWCKR